METKSAVKNEIVFEYKPLEWRAERIKSRLEAIVGGEWGDEPGADLDGVDIAVIRVADVEGIAINVDNLTVRNVQKSKLKGRLITENSLLIEKSGGGENQPVGRSVYPGRFDFDAICSNFMAKIECGATVNPKFLNYLLYSLYCSGFNQTSIKQTTGIQNLDTTAYLSTKVAFPTRQEQDYIVEYLDKQCITIDKVIEVKKGQLLILEELRKSIIHKAVTKGLDDSVELTDSGCDWLGKVPKKWMVKRLKRICSRIQTGTTPPTSNTDYYVDGTIPWFSPGCYEGRVFLKKPAKLINDLALKDNNLRLFPKNTIFIVGIGATIGKVAYIQDEASCNQQITGIVCNDNVFPKYITYLMKVYENIIPNIAQYTTLPIIDQAKIGYLWIVVPPYDEQVSISKTLDAKISELETIEVNLNQEIRILDQYRDSLIHECITGKRRITKSDLKELANV